MKTFLVIHLLILKGVVFSSPVENQEFSAPNLDQMNTELTLGDQTLESGEDSNKIAEYQEPQAQIIEDFTQEAEETQEPAEETTDFQAEPTQETQDSKEPTKETSDAEAEFVQEPQVDSTQEANQSFEKVEETEFEKQDFNKEIPELSSALEKLINFAESSEDYLGTLYKRFREYPQLAFGSFYLILLYLLYRLLKTSKSTVTYTRKTIDESVISKTASVLDQKYDSLQKLLGTMKNIHQEAPRHHQDPEIHSKVDTLLSQLKKVHVAQCSFESSVIDSHKKIWEELSKLETTPQMDTLKPPEYEEPDSAMPPIEELEGFEELKEPQKSDEFQEFQQPQKTPEPLETFETFEVFEPLELQEPQEPQEPLEPQEPQEPQEPLETQKITQEFKEENGIEPPSEPQETIQITETFPEEKEDQVKTEITEEEKGNNYTPRPPAQTKPRKFAFPRPRRPNPSSRPQYVAPQAQTNPFG